MFGGGWLGLVPIGCARGGVGAEEEDDCDGFDALFTYARKLLSDMGAPGMTPGMLARPS